MFTYIVPPDSFIFSIKFELYIDKSILFFKLIIPQEFLLELLLFCNFKF